MIKNVEKFHQWVKENSKSKANNMRAWEDDLLEQIGATGEASFEMSQFETKSGRPETINFERQIEFDENEEVITDNIIF